LLFHSLVKIIFLLNLKSTIEAFLNSFELFNLLIVFKADNIFLLGNLNNLSSFVLISHLPDGKK